MANSFGFSLDITVMIDVLPEIIKALHEKILKAIDLYRFNNDALQKFSSRNDRSNKPQING